MKNDKIGALMSQYHDAKCLVDEEIIRLYPRGSTVRFSIKHGQVNASTGTVLGVGHQAGYIYVDHHQSKPDGRYRYRYVHYSQITD